MGLPKNPTALIIIASVIVVFVLLIVLFMYLKKRKFKKGIKLDVKADEAGPDESSGADCQNVAKKIKKAGKKYHCVVFASVKQDSLPVTVPVNTAIELTKLKKTCLLIDLDLKRDAVGRAFEMDQTDEVISTRALKTGIENLWIMPARSFIQLKQMNVQMIIEQAKDKFDFILINAPALTRSMDRKQIILNSDAVFLCIKDEAEGKKLTDLIESLECKVAGRIHVNTNEPSHEVLIRKQDDIAVEEMLTEEPAQDLDDDILDELPVIPDVAQQIDTDEEFFDDVDMDQLSVPELEELDTDNDGPEDIFNFDEDNNRG